MHNAFATFTRPGQILECTLNCLSFRTQPAIQNVDEARCLQQMWPREQIVSALALPVEIPRVNGIAWAQEAELKQDVSDLAKRTHWQDVNVLID